MNIENLSIGLHSGMCSCLEKTFILDKSRADVQGGQMKSGQILRRNNSKMVLNIVFKFYTLVAEYIGFLQRPVAAQ
jgi:hypothetical protein